MACLCMYETQNGLPRTKYCLVPCEAQQRTTKRLEYLFAALIKDKHPVTLDPLDTE